MTNVNLPTRLTLSEVAAQLQVHVSTVHRWCLRSVRGRQLRSHLVGGRRFVYMSDLHEFLHGGVRPNQEQEVGQVTRHQRAQEQLASFGIRAKADWERRK